MPSSLKQDLSTNTLTIGSWLTLPSPVTAEIMAQAGFPWLVVDLEHSVTDLETAQNMFVAIERHGCEPIVRLSDKDPIQAKRVLDAGARGIIAPMINTVEETQRMVQSVKYPPLGTRGVGLARAQKYGQGFDDNMARANNEIAFICQIEHKDALSNIDEIFDVPGIDGYLIGPYDLSGSLGIPGEFQHPLMLEAEARIMAAAVKRGISPGIHYVHPDESGLQQKIRDGYRFIAQGVDMLYLSDSAFAGALLASKVSS